MLSREELAEAIAGEVADYRQGEIEPMTPEHVLAWANQFDLDDRNAVLAETARILDVRYISKAGAMEFLSAMIDRFTRDFAGGDVQRLLAQMAFLDLQDPGKSQGAMLDLLGEVIGQHGINVRDCGGESPEHYVYLDDVLCTGNTLFQDMKTWWETSGTHGEPRHATLPKHVGIHYVFIAVHDKNCSNVAYRFKMANLPRAMPQRFWRAIHVENDPRKPNAALDFAWPRYGNLGAKGLTYLQQPGFTLEAACRADGLPSEEVLFSSIAARDQFERAVTEKGLDILGSVSNKKENMRPLGYTLPRHKTLGFGALVFTWRNVPNNSPLVFWYDAPGFTPLFKKRQPGIPFSVYFG